MAFAHACKKRAIEVQKRYLGRGARFASPYEHMTRITSLFFGNVIKISSVWYVIEYAEKEKQPLKTLVPIHSPKLSSVRGASTGEGWLLEYFMIQRIRELP